MSATLDRESGPPRHPQKATVSVSPVPREGRPYQGRRAGIVSRLLANSVDFAVVVLLLFGGYAGISAVLFLWSPSAFDFLEPSGALVLAAGAVVMFGYLAMSWVTTGRTYGDHLLGLRVVSFRGERMHLAGATARAALYVVFPVGVLWVAVSRTNRSLQDILLRSSVIYDWSPVQTVRDQASTEQP